jgi:transporter family-2 protein
MNSLVTSRSARVLPSVVIAMLGGLALSVQARINGQLGAQLHDGVLAALISFGTGLLLLALLVPATPAGRRGLSRLVAAFREGGLTWWMCLGGVFGAFLVSTQGLTITSLGVAAFTVAVVGSQVVSGLAVDRAGIGPAGAQRLTWTRLLGAAIAVLAVVVSVSGEFGSPTGSWLIALPALAGIGLSWQQAVNGRVSRAANNSFVAALVNFAVGTVVLVAVTAVLLAVRGGPDTAPGQWWLYVGGSLGILVIASAAMAVRTIGVLMVGLCSVAGQLAGAVLLDLVVPARGEHLAAHELVATGITLVAVAVAALPGHGLRRDLRGWRRDGDDPGRQGDPRVDIR